MNEAIESLKSLPLSNRLLCKILKTLLQGVRGKHKSPGEIRSSQNWIGGASIKDAIFVPPHINDLPELLSDFEKFLNNDEIKLPHLIRVGIAHYQFETIHPFLDGNGRVGRLLITLYMVSNGLLVKPTLYLSDFFEKNKSIYYDNLTRIRTNNDLSQWLKFFLVGVKQTAESSISTFRSIIELRQDVEFKRILTLGKKTKTAQKLLHFLYRNPMVSSQDIAMELDCSASTAFRLVEDFINLGILRETTGYKRNRFFVFEQYLRLFE